MTRLLRITTTAAEPRLTGQAITMDLVDPQLHKLETLLSEVGATTDFLVENEGSYAVTIRFPSGAQQTEVALVHGETPAGLDFEVRRLGAHEELERTAATFRPLPDPGSLHHADYQSVWVRLWRYTGGDWTPVVLPLDEQRSFWAGDAVRYQLRLSDAQYVIQVGGPQVPSMFTALPARGEAGITFVPGGVTNQRLPSVEVIAETDHANAQALLGFLRSGATAHADLVATHAPGLAELMLYGKFENPNAAAIGAYFLLRVGDLERLHTWWSLNLAHYFPWLADGPIVRAWHLLRDADARSRGPEDDSPRYWLLEAVKRGLPVYTEGLRLLIDGLKAVAAGRSDEEVRTAIDHLRPYAAAADWSSATVRFAGSHPSVPDVAPWYGPPGQRAHEVYLFETTDRDLEHLGLDHADLAHRLLARTPRPSQDLPVEQVLTTNLPAPEARRVTTYLRAAGVATLGELAEVAEDELGSISGIGPVRIREIRRALSSLALRPGELDPDWDLSESGRDRRGTERR